MENDALRTALTTQAGKISLIRALQRSATSGLSLNPQSGESALVPIDGKINFWPMKNGIIKKALETGAVEYIQSDTRFENDEFKIKKTAHGDDYEFSPALSNRGKPVAYFAAAVLKSSGRAVVEYWTIEQVEEHKKKYGKGLTKTGSAWNTNFNGMAEKTVLKALLSGLHLPQAVADLLRADEEELRNVTEPPLQKGTSADDALRNIAAEPAPIVDAEDAELPQPPITRDITQVKEALF
jgi:recombination protein RecT